MEKTPAGQWVCAKSPTTHLGPFGEVIRATGPMAKANPFRFSMKYQDDETDLIFYPLRYYNISTGRWLSRDPIEEQGGHTLYGFCQNAPLIYIDPLGNVHWMQVLNGSLQVASGVMMWAAAGASEVGTGGLATPAAYGLGIWGSFSIVNGIKTVWAAVHDKGSPEALQVQIVTTTYEAVTGTPMGPKGLMITRSAYFAIDIATCLYGIHADWTTASETGLLIRTYKTTDYTTRQLVQAQKVTSHLQFNWTGLNNVPMAGQTAYDFYSLWQDISDWNGSITNPEPVPPPLFIQ